MGMMMCVTKSWSALVHANAIPISLPLVALNICFAAEQQYVSNWRQSELEIHGLIRSLLTDSEVECASQRSRQ